MIEKHLRAGRFILPLVLIGASLLIATLSAHAQWTLGEWQLGTNGHYYSVQAITGPDYSWLIARSQARALTAPDGSSCDLATLTSPDENSFA